MAAYEICQSLIQKRPKKAKKGQKRPKKAKKGQETATFEKTYTSMMSQLFSKITF